MRRTLPPLALAVLALAAFAIPPAAAQRDHTVFLPALARDLAFSLRAGYLGTAAPDAVSAVDFGADDDLLVAGSFPDLAPAGVSSRTLLGGGAGAVLRLDPTGSQILALTRVGANLADMEVSDAGPLVVCGGFGVAVLSADLASVLWSDSPGAASRCAIDGAGRVAALVGNSAFRYAADGSGRTSWAVAGTSALDLAIDAASGLVVVTGYTQKNGNLQAAYLRAYDAAGGLRWTNYDYAASAIEGQGLGSDTRGHRVSIGRDGLLYFTGSTAGGASIYGRDPRDVARQLGAGEIVAYDAFTRPFNVGGQKFAWYGRFEPASGTLLRGQWLLTRRGNNQGNSISIQAIDAAEDGTVVLAGDTAYAIQGRAGMQFAGVPLGDYELAEPYFLVVSPDLTERRLWTALAAPGTSAGSSPLLGGAIRDGVLVVGGTLNPREAAPQRALFTTPDAPQPQPAGGSEGYLLTMPVP